MKLKETLNKIEPSDPHFEEAAWQHWDRLCHPLRGFGKLESIVAQMAAVQRTEQPHADRRAAVIMGADNGVVCEGVSQSGPEVTSQVLYNMGERISSVCVMSRILNLEIFPVNIGTLSDIDHPKVFNLPVRHGTGDIMKEPAMTRQECVRAIETGIEAVEKLSADGYDLVITGEMGIGNTTTSSACACVLLGRTPEEMTGRGAGLSTEGLRHKTEVVRKALEINHPDPGDPIDVLSRVGGLDIAGMVGLYLGGALCRMPVLIDGVISGISALIASRICPASKDYMFATHCSHEPAAELTFQSLGLEPVLYADMHLGEGTGAAAALPLFDQGLNVYYNLPEFKEGNVEQYRHLT